MPPTITMQRVHNLDEEQAKQLVETVVAELQDEVAFRYSWEGPELTLSRRGAKGLIRVGPSEVHIEVTLSLAMRPLKRKLEREITKYLDEYMPENDSC